MSDTVKPYVAVVNAYCNAEDNGYSDKLAAMTDEQLTDDLMDCDSDCQQHPREEILEAVRVYRIPYYKDGLL